MKRSRSYHPALRGLILSVILMAHGTAFGKGSVVNSPHNLSVSGGLGQHRIKFEEIRVCVFCHTPHNALGGDASAPLWNRVLSEQQYSMYESPYFNAKVSSRFQAPTGASRLCLSCHDGTLALNRYGGPVLSSSGGPVQGNLGAPVFMPTETDPSKNPNLSPDLSGDHPISFLYDGLLAGSANLVQPQSLPPAVKLEKGILQCTACHDPHDNEFGNFLVMNNGDPAKPEYNPSASSPLCVTCHAPPGWDNSSPHYAGAGCLNCHTVHTAPVKQYLLNDTVSQTCIGSCHTSSPPTHADAGGSLVSLLVASVVQAVQPLRSLSRGADLRSLFEQQPYRHPIGLNRGTHRENEQVPVREPHVECVDCHNPHAAGSSSTATVMRKRSLRGVRGVSKDTRGSVTASQEYEICYRCHSGAFAIRFVGISKPNRVITEHDQMKRFKVGNPSFHPVAADRRTGSSGDSLLAQYRSSMIRIDCSDCHGSDRSKKAGGAGPNGPHASRYEHILLARYEMPQKGAAARSSNCTDYRSEYALCFTCHSEDFVLQSGTSFVNGGVNEHSRHVVDRCIPCFVCHDPHGVPVEDGATTTNNAHLINFDRGYAAGRTLPVPRYTTLAPGRGSCAVACHGGATHSRSYAR